MLRQQMFVRRPPDVDRASSERQRLAAARRRLEAEAQNLENEISDLTAALRESRDADNNDNNDRMPGRPDVNQELHRMREELGIAEVDDLFYPGEGGFVPNYVHVSHYDEPQSFDGMIGGMLSLCGDIMRQQGIPPMSAEEEARVLTAEEHDEMRRHVNGVMRGELPFPGSDPPRYVRHGRYAPVGDDRMTSDEPFPAGARARYSVAQGYGV